MGEGLRSDSGSGIGEMESNSYLSGTRSGETPSSVRAQHAREITRDYARLREITRDYKPLTSATKTTAMIPGLVNGRPSKIGEQRWDLECFHHRTRYGRADVCGPTLLSPHGSSRHASSRHALITRYDCFPTVMSQRMPLRRHISVSRNGLSYLLTIRLS